MWYIGDNDNEYGLKYGDEGIFMCSNCGYIVCNDDTRCDNCMQVLDWEE